MGKKKHPINIVFAILLLGIFAFTAVFVAIMGVTVYSNSADKLQANFDTRTSLVYLSEKIRTNSGGFDVREIEGASALVLKEEVRGVSYESWIFVSDERLCETRITQGGRVLPAAAQKIMDLKSMDVALKDGGVEISVETLTGDKSTTFVYGRAER